MTELTSPRNPRVRAAAELRERRARERTGLTLIDGVRELSRALDAGPARIAIEEAFVDEARLAELGRADADALVERLAAAGARLQRVGSAVVERLAFGDRAEGVVAVARPAAVPLDALALPADPLIVVLEAVEKPGNLGAVLRSADGAGADALILADPRTDVWNPNAIRASLGTIFALPIASAPSAAVRAWLAATAIRPLAARVDADALHTDADLRGAVAIVLGSEATGLGEAWQGPDVDAVRLPMLGIADSLNVSVAAAVLLYEARRQRGLPTPSQPIAARRTA